MISAQTILYYIYNIFSLFHINHLSLPQNDFRFLYQKSVCFSWNGPQITFPFFKIRRLIQRKVRFSIFSPFHFWNFIWFFFLFFFAICWRSENLVKSSRMSGREEDGIDSIGCKFTPLSAVADAFEDLSAVVNSGSFDGDLDLKSFCDACSLVSVLFGCLGTAFKFAELEYCSKVNSPPNPLPPSIYIYRGGMICYHNFSGEWA